MKIRVSKSGVHERGAYAAAFIPRGTRIIEYTGRRVRESEMPEDDDANPHTFLFGLDDGIVIDPEVGGNEARWINHGCDPNCETIDEDGRIFVYALRDIEPGEELLYDYALEIDDPITPASRKLYECLCGSPQCRGTMLGI